MEKQLLQRYKDLYYQLGLTQRVLSELAEEYIDDMADTEPNNILCEKALDVFIKYSFNGIFVYRVLEINLKAGDEHVKEKYDELEKIREKDHRFKLKGGHTEENLIEKGAKIYWVSDYSSVADIQKIYLEERIRGNTHKEAIEYLDSRYESETILQAKNEKIRKEKAEKAKVLSILMDISRLYQEVGQFKKSIEITQICSQLNSGEKTLNEPLLNTYKIHKNEKNKDLKIDSVEKTSALDSNENDSSNLKQPETEVQEPESVQETKSQQFTFPKGIDYPVAVSFCSDFFKNLQKYFPHLKDLCQCNVTIIIDRVLGFYETAIIRISSDKLSGKDLKEGILTAYGCFKKPTEKEPDFYIFPCGKFYCKTTDHEIYFSEKPLD